MVASEFLRDDYFLDIEKLSFDIYYSVAKNVVFKVQEFVMNLTAII